MPFVVVDQGGHAVKALVVQAELALVGAHDDDVVGGVVPEDAEHEVGPVVDVSAAHGVVAVLVQQVLDLLARHHSVVVGGVFDAARLGDASSVCLGDAASSQFSNRLVFLRCHRRSRRRLRG